MILTLSGQRAAGCVRCAHSLSDRDLFTRLPLPGLAPRHFAAQPKNMLFPLAISFYLGAFAQTGRLAFQTWVPLFFLSLCGALHSGLRAA